MPFDRTSWDGSEVQSSLDAEDFLDVCMVVSTPEGEDPLKRYGQLPVKKTPDSNPNVSAIRAIGSGSRGLPAIQLPEGGDRERWRRERGEAANQIITWWRELFDQEAPAPIFRIAGKRKPQE